MDYGRDICDLCGGDLYLNSKESCGKCGKCGMRSPLSKLSLLYAVEPIESMLSLAEEYYKLGNRNTELDILNSVARTYPNDYRAWWAIAQIHMGMPYNRNNNLYGEMDEYRFTRSFKTVADKLIRPQEALLRAKSTAPADKLSDIKRKTLDWYSRYLEFFKDEKEKINKYHKYLKQANNINRRINENYENAKFQRAFFAIALCIVELIFVFNHLAHPSGWLLLIIPAQFFVIPLILLLAGGLRKTGRHNNFEAWHSYTWYEDKEWANAVIKRDAYRGFWEYNSRYETDNVWTTENVDSYIDIFSKIVEEFV